MTEVKPIRKTSATRAQLFAFLDAHGIAHKTMDHAAVFTVDEGQEIKQSITGGHSKNLFLKDKSGKLFLICALGDTKIAINHLHKKLGCKRLSFGKPELLWQALGVRPGSVCLFSVLNDSQSEVQLILDQAIMAHDIINFHPLENTATTSISTADMIKFGKAANHDPIVIDFALE